MLGEGDIKHDLVCRLGRHEADDAVRRKIVPLRRRETIEVAGIVSRWLLLDNFERWPTALSLMIMDNVDDGVDLGGAEGPISLKRRRRIRKHTAITE